MVVNIACNCSAYRTCNCHVLIQVCIMQTRCHLRLSVLEHLPVLLYRVTLALQRHIPLSCVHTELYLWPAQQHVDGNDSVPACANYFFQLQQRQRSGSCCRCVTKDFEDLNGFGLTRRVSWRVALERESTTAVQRDLTLHHEQQPTSVSASRRKNAHASTYDDKPRMSTPNVMGPSNHRFRANQLACKTFEQRGIPANDESQNCSTSLIEPITSQNDWMSAQQ